jgi:hypothetical protein
MATLNLENNRPGKNNIIDQLQEAVPPISLQDYIRDKKNLGKKEFIAQYTKASGNPKEAEELAREIYQDEDQE